MVEEPTRPPGADRSPANAVEREPDSDVVRVGDGCAPLTIAGYQIVRSLGPRGRGGGQAEVFEAIQESTTQTVAIKILRREAHSADAMRQQFRREIELLARVKHPNIVTIHEAGETGDGRLFFAMEFVRGLDLRSFVQIHRLNLKQVLELFVTVCSAVDHLHRMGVVHRDLKPANILVDDEGRVKVLDLGLARPLALPELLPASGWAGTLPYLSPEQTRPTSEAPDSRSDVYSLGVVLYDLLTGHLPHTMSGSIESILERIRHEPITPPREAWDRDALLYSYAGSHCPIDEELESIVLHSLSLERADRYTTAGELGRNVSRYLRDEPVDPIPAGKSRASYQLKIGLRRFVQRQPVVACLLAALILWTFVEFAGTRLLYRWTPLNEYYERIAHRLLPAPAGPDSFQHVRIVGINEETLRELERQPGHAAMGGAGFGPFLRATHGRLMTRLADAAKCRVVAWDFWFRTTSPFDQAFVDGVRRIKQQGGDVVIGMPRWWLEESSRPEISPAIDAESVLGCAFADFGKNAFRVVIAAQRGFGDPLPSLPLAAVAAFRQPGARYDIRIDPAKSAVVLRYYRPDPADPRKKINVGSEDTFSLSYISIGDDGSAAFSKEHGLEPTDTIGSLQFAAPEAESIARSTLRYEDVLEADDAQLREWFADRVVLFGNTRPTGSEVKPTSDGRLVPAVYGLAAAIENLLRAQAFRYPASLAEGAMSLAAAMIGCAAGARLFRRPPQRRLVLLAVTIAAGLLSIVLIRGWHLNWNPMVTVLSLWVTGESVARLISSSRRAWVT